MLRACWLAAHRSGSTAYERRGPPSAWSSPCSSAVYLALRAAARGAVLTRWPRASSRSLVFLALVVAIAPLLGALHGPRVQRRAHVPGPGRSGPVERLTYRLLRVDPDRGAGLEGLRPQPDLPSRAVGWLALYLILRTQTLHPFNPQGFHSGTWDLSFNTASSFVTNTNWQYYAGETTLSYFSQMAGLTVQNFVSAAVGITVAVALIRGLAARRTGGRPCSATSGSTSSATCCYVLLPIAFVAALVLVSQGVAADARARRSRGPSSRGPVASQEAIKELGTNGGGFFNVNSAHPFENPNGAHQLRRAAADPRDPGVA